MMNNECDWMVHGPHPFLLVVTRQPATAKWYDRRDAVFVDFCVEDSKNVKVNFENSKFDFG